MPATYQIFDAPTYQEWANQSNEERGRLLSARVSILGLSEAHALGRIIDYWTMLAALGGIVAAQGDRMRILYGPGRHGALIMGSSGISPAMLNELRESWGETGDVVDELRRATMEAEYQEWSEPSEDELAEAPMSLGVWNASDLEVRRVSLRDFYPQFSESTIAFLATNTYPQLRANLHNFFTSDDPARVLREAMHGPPEPEDVAERSGSHPVGEEERRSGVEEIGELFRRAGSRRVAERIPMTEEEIEQIYGGEGRPTIPYHVQMQRIRRDVVDRVKHFIYEEYPYRGEDQEREEKYKRLLQDICQIYGMRTPTLNVSDPEHAMGSGYYDQSRNHIEMPKWSVVTLLHEFRHCMQSQRDDARNRAASHGAEPDARAWSLSLVYKAAPERLMRMVRQGIVFFVSPQDVLEYVETGENLPPLIDAGAVLSRNRNGVFVSYGIAGGAHSPVVFVSPHATTESGTAEAAAELAHDFGGWMFINTKFDRRAAEAPPEARVDLNRISPATFVGFLPDVKNKISELHEYNSLGENQNVPVFILHGQKERENTKVDIGAGWVEQVGELMESRTVFPEKGAGEPTAPLNKVEALRDTLRDVGLLATVGTVYAGQDKEILGQGFHDVPADVYQIEIARSIRDEILSASGEAGDRFLTAMGTFLTEHYNLTRE